MTERIDDILANGAAFAPANIPASSGGFNVGNQWDGHYDFSAIKGCEKIVGDIPIPSQPKLDRWQKAAGYLAAEIEIADEQERKARRELASEDSEKTLEELKAEVDKAIAYGNEVVEKFRDALADVTSANPTRAELKKIPDPWVLRFVTHVGELLNPNV
jgi:hypothetical protein